MFTEYDIERATVQIECKFEGGTSLGTGFFVAKNLIVTAQHVVQKYFDEEKLIGNIYITPIKANIDKDISVKSIQSSKNNYIAILELEEEVENIQPLRFTKGYDIKKDDEFFTYGYPIDKRILGLSIKDSVLSDINEMQCKKIDWDLKVSKEKLKSFSGMSGAPVAIDGMIIGILQTQSESGEIAVGIGMSSMSLIENFISGEYCEEFNELKYLLMKNNKEENIYQIADIDNNLKQCMQNSIDLDFFEIDDEQFLSKFDEMLNSKYFKSIYIEGQSREEVLYSILNHLKFDEIWCKKTLIVNDKESWGFLNGKIKGYIVIPNFYAAEIIELQDNLNIFLYSEGEYCTNSNKIILKKRLKRTNIKKLEKYGMEYSEAYNLIESTNGMFYALKRKLLKGQYNEVPLWAKETSESFVIALLCGKWENNSSDIAKIELLLGKEYEVFLDDLSPFMKGEEPFIIEINYYNRKKYQLANSELSWSYLSPRVTQFRWDKFESWIINIFQSDISQFLKEGIIRTLIFRAINDKFQNEVDQLIKKIFETISSQNEWQNISPYLSLLLEASPKAVIEAIEFNIRESNEFKKVFDTESSWDSSTYTKILWALEKLVLYREYAARVVKCLFEIDSWNFKYIKTNSPKDTLRYIFYPFYNGGVFTLKERIKLLTFYIKNYKNTWNLLYELIPCTYQSIMISRSMPQFREIDKIIELSNKEMNELALSYTNLCIEEVDDIDRYIKIIEIFSGLNEEFFIKLLSKLSTEFTTINNDVDRRIVKEKLREYIYNHRFFKYLEWSMNEKNLKKLETLFNDIEFDDDKYNYLYLLKDVWSINIINPLSFKDSDDSYKKNDDLKLEEVKNGIEEIKKKEIDIIGIIKLTKSNDYRAIGQYLAEYYTNGNIDIELIKKLVKINGLKDLLVNYIGWFYRNKKKVQIEDIKNIVFNYESKHDLYIEILQFEYLDIKSTPKILAESVNVKELYWTKFDNMHIACRDRETTDWLLLELIQYNNVITYIEIIYRRMDLFTADEILDYMKKIIDFKEIPYNSMISYYIEQILGNIINCFENKYERYYEIMQIEVKFNDFLKWKAMKATKHIFATEPRHLVEVIVKLFNSVEKNEYENKRAIYKFYEKIKFCPCEESGNIDLNKLKEWIQEFRNLLIENNLGDKIESTLGRLFAYSPVGKDGFYPHEAVRDIIEYFSSEELRNSYIIAECNKRGVYQVTAGSEESEIAKKYKLTAEGMRMFNIETAKIYDVLAEHYTSSSANERIFAENEF